MNIQPAKPIEASAWLNTDTAITLKSVRGKVVLLEAFQMLCPGCVSHSLPQAMKVRQLFNEDDVAVIGLHSVFEHHEAQGSKEALAAFLHEYRLSFPVAIDKQSANSQLPVTMKSYGMRGTPTTILIDRQGNIRKHKFGKEDDLLLGAEIMALMSEAAVPQETAKASTAPKDGCTDEGCTVPQNM
jgi:peroxiredoxin